MTEPDLSFRRRMNQGLQLLVDTGTDPKQTREGRIAALHAATTLAALLDDSISNQIDEPYEGYSDFLGEVTSAAVTALDPDEIVEMGDIAIAVGTETMGWVNDGTFCTV